MYWWSTRDVIVLEWWKDTSVILHDFQWDVEEQSIEHWSVTFSCRVYFLGFVKEICQFLCISNDTSLTTYSTWCKSLDHTTKAIWLEFSMACLTEDAHGLNWSSCQAAEGTYTFKLGWTAIIILNIVIDLQAFFHIMMVQDFIALLNKKHIMFFIIRDKH